MIAAFLACLAVIVTAVGVVEWMDRRMTGWARLTGEDDR